MGCLIIFKSITYAQRAAAVLSRIRISAVIIKPPVSLGRGSCSYALRIRTGELSRAADALKNTSIPISGAYVREGSGYREVMI